LDGVSALHHTCTFEIVHPEKFLRIGAGGQSAHKARPRNLELALTPLFVPYIRRCGCVRGRCSEKRREWLEATAMEVEDSAGYTVRSVEVCCDRQRALADADCLLILSDDWQASRAVAHTAYI